MADPQLQDRATWRLLTRGFNIARSSGNSVPISAVDTTFAFGASAPQLPPPNLKQKLVIKRGSNAQCQCEDNAGKITCFNFNMFLTLPVTGPPAVPLIGSWAPAYSGGLLGRSGFAVHVDYDFEFNGSDGLQSTPQGEITQGIVNGISPITLSCSADFSNSDGAAAHSIDFFIVALFELWEIVGEMGEKQAL